MEEYDDVLLAFGESDEYRHAQSPCSGNNDTDEI